ncbi:MAG TPA: nucleoside/nucleotide kinase family protein [Arachnia sp.]|nr:nucleoside/nucleotide kinase family protein [Arachnia sp.]HMT85738.1 nucleoside/nucleotide kinase family protein [Arachnia sp.]
MQLVSVAQAVERARGLLSRPSRAILGIVGAPGAGKSTLAAALSAELGDVSALVAMDGFHLDNEVLVALGRRDRKGAPDTFDVSGYASLLRRLRRRDEDVVYAPRFDRSLELSIGSAVAVRRETPLVITEGNYLLHDEHGWQAVGRLLDEVWFLDVPAEELRRRLVARRMGHGESEEQAAAWVRQVDEPNAALVTAGREAADLVVRLAGEPG